MAEAKPLIEAAPAEPPTFIPDFVITFPRTVPDQKDPTPTYDAKALDALFDEVLLDREPDQTLSESFSSIGRFLTGEDFGPVSPRRAEPEEEKESMYPECEALEKKVKAEGPVDLDTVQNALLKDLTAYLVKNGCTTSAFMSCDKDELFVLISLGDSRKPAQDDPGALAAAQTLAVRLQTVLNPHNILKLSMKQQLKPGEEAYAVFNEEVSATATTSLRIGKPGSLDLYKTYSEGIAGTNGSCLRTVDRYRILIGLLNSFLDLDDAMGCALVNDHYIPHKLSKLEEFRSGKADGPYGAGHEAWSNFNYKTIVSPLSPFGEGIPATEIRNYFGERIGYYFLWLSFTAKFIAILVPCSVTFGVLYSTISEETPDGQAGSAAAHLIAALFFCIASAFYQKFWTRLQAHYSELWDMNAASFIKTSCRPDYRGEMTENPLDEFHKKKEYGWKKAWGVKLLSYAITSFFIGVVMVSVCAIYMLEKGIPVMTKGKVNTKTAISICSAIFSVQICVYQLVWDGVSDQLVELSNPRTEEDAKNLAVQFLFPFSMISAYANIIYHAFYKSWGDGCMDSDCMRTMRPAMYQVVLPALLMQFVSLLKPYVKYRYDLSSEAKRLKENNPDVQVDRTFIEVQAKSEAFSGATLNKEMNLMMILLGYSMLFGFVAPGITVAMAVTFLVKVRIDAFKLCSVYQRVASPSSGGVKGIGEWNEMIGAIAHIGRWTSFIIPVFNLEYFQNEKSPAVQAMMELKEITATRGVSEAMVNVEYSAGLPFYQKVALVCVLKILADFFCTMIDYAIGNVSSETLLMASKRQAVTQKLTHKLASARREEKRRQSVGDNPNEEAPVIIPKWVDKVIKGSLEKLDTNHPDWSMYDSQDFAPLGEMKTYFGAKTGPASVSVAASGDPEAPAP